MTIAPLRIATRGSRLALWQAYWIREQIQTQHTDIPVELKIIKTTGDIILDRPLAQIGGKGLFVKELETALMENEADLAVHSMKDVSSELPEGLEISVITEREDHRDALISSGNLKFEDLPQGAVIGTSSLRRAAQLKHARPDLCIRTLRGNVETRLRKVHEGEYDATILAVAGLKRLEMEEHIAYIFQPEIMLSAVAQGAIGIETRIEDERTLSFLKHLHHVDTTDCLRAERSLLIELEGNCQIPLAGYASTEGDSLNLHTLIASPDGAQRIEYQTQGKRSDAVQLGRDAAEYLLSHGGKNILQSL